MGFSAFEKCILTELTPAVSQQQRSSSSNSRLLGFPYDVLYDGERKNIHAKTIVGRHEGIQVEQYYFYRPKSHQQPSHAVYALYIMCCTASSEHSRRYNVFFRDTRSNSAAAGDGNKGCDTKVNYRPYNRARGTCIPLHIERDTTLRYLTCLPKAYLRLLISPSSGQEQ